MARTSHRPSQTYRIRGCHIGALLVLRRLPNKSKKSRWLCRCDCGNTTSTYGEYLKVGRLLDCGCGAYEQRAAN